VWGVLFAAQLAGHLGYSIPSGVGTLGLVRFVYCGLVMLVSLVPLLVAYPVALIVMILIAKVLIGLLV
jgi:hypothetical protein